MLAIGVNKYNDPALTLHFATNDARTVPAAFNSPRSSPGLYERVVIHEPVLDGDVTRQHLRTVFEALGKEVQPDDVFVLYMAGHGQTEDGRYYFIPQDADNTSHEALIASSIGQGELQQWLALIPALRSVLIYDTCQSGSNVEERTGFRTSQHLVAAEKLSRSMGRTVLAATTDSESAKAGYAGFGIFTFALLDALALADQNNDGQIEVTELANYLTTNLPDLSERAGFGRQSPQVKVIGADFALTNRATISEIDNIRSKGQLSSQGRN